MQINRVQLYIVILIYRGENILNISLKSDFVDYYDGAMDVDYDESDVVYIRPAEREMDKIETFTFLREELGFMVPTNGLVSDIEKEVRDKGLLKGKDLDRLEIVIYDDISIRDGGKKIVPYKEAIKKMGDSYGSLYVGHSTPEGIFSYKYIEVCGQIFWSQSWNRDLKAYWSTEGQDVVCDVVDMGTELTLKMIPDYPIYELDFIKVDGLGLVGLSFCDSPMLWGSGVEYIINPDHMIALLKEHLFYQERGEDYDHEYKTIFKAQE